MRLTTRRPTVLDGLAGFASCPQPVRQQLAAHADVFRPSPGTVLARQGAVAREVVVVVTGQLVVDRDGRPGAPLGPGASFGAAEVLAGGTHRTTIVADVGVELRVITGPAFRAAAAHLPALVPPGSLPRAG